MRNNRRVFRAKPPAAARRYLLSLYITGHTPGSLRAIRDLKALVLEGFKDRYKLDIIDVLRHPEIAERDHIVATPTLVKRLPPPLRRIIGNLADRDHVLNSLDLVTIDPT